MRNTRVEPLLTCDSLWKYSIAMHPHPPTLSVERAADLASSANIWRMFLPTSELIDNSVDPVNLADPAAEESKSRTQ